jgi:hypothetical protein
VRFHNFLHDCEAKSGTSKLRTRSAPEPIEYAVPIGGRNAGPLIGHTHTCIATNAHEHFGTSWRMDDRIFHQVPDRVGDLMSVAIGMRGSIRALECELPLLDQSPWGHSSPT